jgi:hypothetical protein
VHCVIYLLSAKEISVWSEKQACSCDRKMVIGAAGQGLGRQQDGTSITRSVECQPMESFCSTPMQYMVADGWWLIRIWLIWWKFNQARKAGELLRSFMQFQSLPQIYGFVSSLNLIVALIATYIQICINRTKQCAKMGVALCVNLCSVTVKKSKQSPLADIYLMPANFKSSQVWGFPRQKSRQSTVFEALVQ